MLTIGTLALDSLNFGRGSGVAMKAGRALLFPVSVLGLIIILAIPSFAQSGSYSSTATTTAPATSNTQASDHPGTTTTTTATENSGSSWKQSASDAAHNAEVATEKAYNEEHDVKDISLEARVKAVLHEKKSTGDSNVHVRADNGVVTLTGRVPSKQSAQRVQQVAASVHGVKAVNNDLNYPGSRGAVTLPDADSMGIAHPAYSDTAPAENAPAH